MDIKIKAISFMLIILPMTCPGEEKKMVPTSKEELTKWIVGTEWVNKQIGQEKWVYVVRRFYPNNVMKFQSGVKKWTVGTPILTHSYKVISRNSIEFGDYHWSAVFNEDFSEYTSKSEKRKVRGKGTYLGTFKDE